MRKLYLPPPRKYKVKYNRRVFIVGIVVGELIAVGIAVVMVLIMLLLSYC